MLPSLDEFIEKARREREKSELLRRESRLLRRHIREVREALARECEISRQRRQLIVAESLAGLGTPSPK